MTRKYLNQSNIPLSVAVFLATDSYDHDDDPNTISATALMKPLRQIILASRVPAGQALPDIGGLLSSRMGTAIHDKIEDSWLNNHREALAALGTPARVIDRVKVNPDPATVTEDDIPVYLEIRSHKKVGKWTISGKFDFVADGRVEDFKSTKTYSWSKRDKDEAYILQGSIYRWLNPTIVTQDVMAINFIFTDWQAVRARTDASYPQKAIEQRVFQLKPTHEVEQFVRQKLMQIEKYWDADEEDIPYCSDKDLWRTESKFKYYKNAAKTNGRSTKNFDSRQEAYTRLAQDGNVGVVIEEPGQVKACHYCPAFTECRQKDALAATGVLKL